MYHTIYNLIKSTDNFTTGEYDQHETVFQTGSYDEIVKAAHHAVAEYKKHGYNTVFGWSKHSYCGEFNCSYCLEKDDVTVTVIYDDGSSITDFRAESGKVIFYDSTDVKSITTEEAYKIINNKFVA